VQKEEKTPKEEVKNASENVKVCYVKFTIRITISGQREVIRGLIRRENQTNARIEEIEMTMIRISG